MLDNLFPVFLFFTLGYICKRFSILPESYSRAFIDFIITVAFPALVIYNVYHLTYDTAFLAVLFIGGWGAIGLCIITAFLTGKILKLERNTLITFIMMATFGNTGFLGFPFVNAFLGTEGLRYAVVFDQVAAFLPISFLGPLILGFSESGPVRINLKKIVTFPPFIALICSFLVREIAVPQFVLQSLNTLGLTVIPLALFSVGMDMKFSHIKLEIKSVSVLLFIKMLFAPLFLLLMIKLLGVPLDLPWMVGIMEIAMPPMVLASIFIIRADLDKDLALSAVGAGILLSFVTVPLIYILLNV